MKKISYPNPPIVEAVCEIRVNLKKPFNSTIPGMFYQEIKDSYPKIDQENEVITKIVHENNIVKHKINRVDWTSFSKEENHDSRIRLSRDRLSIHQFEPYHSWK